MLKYYKRMKDEDKREEISHDEALNVLFGSFRDNDMTRDMLTIPNRIICQFSEIEVVDDRGNNDIRVLMAGLCNMLPMDTAYDDNGMRI